MRKEFTSKNMKKLSKYLEINEVPIYNQLINTKSSFILKENFLIDFLEQKVNSGELSKITADNLPYLHSYNNNDLVRKIKIQKILNDSNVELVYSSSIDRDNIEYNSVLFETGIVRKCSINKEANLNDKDLSEILSFCKSSGITHIFKIIEKRFGLEINKNDLSIKNIFTIDNFSNYGLNYSDIKHSSYRRNEDCSEEVDMCKSVAMDTMSESDYDDNYYNVDINDRNYKKNNIKDCYIFNEVSYSIRGMKTYDKKIVDEFTNCKLDFEYFYKNYFYKK